MAQTLNPGDSIQNAINSSPGSGEVITLNAGTYNVSNGSVPSSSTDIGAGYPAGILLNKHCNIIGGGATPADTIIDMSDISGNSCGLAITADGTSESNRITVENVSLVGDFGTIMIGKVNDIQQFTTLRNVEISGAYFDDIMIGNRDITAPKDDTYIVKYLEMFDVNVSSNAGGHGMMIYDTLQYFEAENLNFNGNDSCQFGFHLEMQPDDFMATEESTNWKVKNLNISNFTRKGFYIESLDMGYMEDVTITNCGVGDPASPSWGHTGFEFNMKRGNYQNILIKNLNVTNCGTANPNSMAVAFRGRDKMTDPFASYGQNPGVVSNVSILGGSIDGGNIGLCLGEYYNGAPAYNMSPERVDVRDFTIENVTVDYLIDARANRNGFLFNGKLTVA